MSAWGHTIHAIGDAPCCRSEKTERGRQFATCSNGLRCPGVHEVTFMEPRWDGSINAFVSNVGGPANWHASYVYVTGRAGRTTRRDLPLCDACAEKWRRRNVPNGAA